VYNLNYTPITFRGYKVEDKLHLGVHEQKRLNATSLDNRITNGGDVVSLTRRLLFNPQNGSISGIHLC
jgi:hypothetical protein